MVKTTSEIATWYQLHKGQVALKVRRQPTDDALKPSIRETQFPHCFLKSGEE